MQMGRFWNWRMEFSWPPCHACSSLEFMHTLSGLAIFIFISLQPQRGLVHNKNIKQIGTMKFSESFLMFMSAHSWVIPCPTHIGLDWGCVSGTWCPPRSFSFFFFFIYLFFFNGLTKNFLGCICAMRESHDGEENYFEFLCNPAMHCFLNKKREKKMGRFSSREYFNFLNRG